HKTSSFARHDGQHSLRVLSRHPLNLPNYFAHFLRRHIHVSCYRVNFHAKKQGGMTEPATSNARWELGSATLPGSNSALRGSIFMLFRFSFGRMRSVLFEGARQ